MIRLRVLGGFGLVLGLTGTPPVPGLRPRVLGLLALLAGHRSEGISRDKLLGYLWPDSDSVHARNSLKQALFSLRHALDCQLPISGCGFLHLEYSAAEVDLWEFESALEMGTETLAVSLYGGPFLDGFYITGLAEFERWAEARRQRLAHQYSQTLSALAVRADRSGDHHSAITWWRRLAAAEPLSAIPALGLMRALQAAGDPTGALDHGRKHAAMVESELGAPASEEIRALMRRLAFQGRSPKPVHQSRLQLLHHHGPEVPRAPSAERVPAS
jgi:DNA-binding SARP family transcriptional activator